MRGGFRVFDTHVHVGTARHSGRRYTADQLLADMDRHGVDRALVIPFPVVEDVRAAHDEIGRAVRAHGDRLAGAACIPPFLSPGEFQGELRRCVETHGFRALKFQPQYHGVNPVSPRSDFLFEAAREHRLPVVCHTGNGIPFALPSLFIAPARRFPDVKLILGHAGGSVYYLESVVAAQVCPNVFVEVSSLAPHHVADLLAYVPSSRILCGSDLPESVDAEIGKIVTLDVAEEVRRDILWNTAEGLFG